MQKISSSLAPMLVQEKKRPGKTFFHFPEFAQPPKILVPSMTMTLQSEGLLVNLRIFPVITLNPNLEGLEFLSLFFFFFGQGRFNFNVEWSSRDRVDWPPFHQLLEIR